MDMRRKGRGITRLTPEQVIEIRKSTKTLDMIAAQFGVSQTTINSVRQRKTWKWVIQ